MDGNYGGSQLVTASGVIGNSGQPVRIYAIHVISGATAGVVSLRSGSSSGGTIWVTETGAISTGATKSYGTPGIFFPSGAYLSIDGNTTSVLVSYIQS